MRLLRDANQRKMLSAVTVFLLAVVVLCSSFFLAVEADHDCCGDEDCPVCSCIELCERILCHFGRGALAVAVMLLPVVALFAAVVAAVRERPWETLVSRKVRIEC
ncbi:MAG: hypothetical protein J5645_05500 [Lachnospiraceae bacterium]|nr:hypothetical protein [Lachnospiraceae bacterium]